MTFDVMTLRDQAQDLTKKGALLLEGQDGKAPSAEDLQNAEKMFEDAKALRERASRMLSLKAAHDTEMKAWRQEDADAQAQQEQHKGEPGPNDFKTWPEFLETVAAVHKGQVDARLRVFDKDLPHGRKVLTGSAQGGEFLIPDQFIAQLQALTPQQAIVRPRASVIPVDRREIQLPVLDQNQALAAGNARWFGGLLFFWEDEAATINTSSVNFRQATHTVRELTGYTLIGNSTLQDSAISLGAFFEGPLGFAGGAAWMEDFAFLNGDGVGKPLGVIHAPATLAAARAGSGVAFVDLIGILEQFWGSGGVWVANRNLLSNLTTMEGPSGNPSYLWISAEQGAPAQLLGYPIIFTEKAAAVGSKGDIGLYDFSYYNIVDRRSASIDLDSSERFSANQTAFRLVHRVGGQPWLSAPLTFQDQSTQASPFVVLDAA